MSIPSRVCNLCKERSEGGGMDRIKSVSEKSPMALNQRKRNWWDDEDEFESKWMTGPAAENANAPQPLSMLNPAKTNKDAILISQQNRYDGKSVRTAKTAPYGRPEEKRRGEHNGEQYTFAFFADPHIDTEA